MKAFQRNVGEGRAREVLNQPSSSVDAAYKKNVTKDTFSKLQQPWGYVNKWQVRRINEIRPLCNGSLLDMKSSNCPREPLWFKLFFSQSVCKAGAILGVFSPTAFAVVANCNFNFLGCSWHMARSVVRIQNINKAVVLYRHSADCKNKGCCSLCCCYSSYGFVATIEWKEEAVVG